MIKSLLIRSDLAAGEQDYIDFLTNIVERCERETRPMPRVTDAELLRHLVDARRISWSKLSTEVGIPFSTMRRRLCRHTRSGSAGSPASAFSTASPTGTSATRAVLGWRREPCRVSSHQTEDHLVCPRYRPWIRAAKHR